MRWRIARTLEAVVLVACGLGCGDDHSIQAYQAPKDDPNASLAMPAADQAASAGAQGNIKWTLPEGWKELAAQNMEFARLGVSADSPQTVVTLVPLGGMAGGLLPNVQRWEGQLKLPASTEADLPNLLSHINVAGAPAEVVDLSQAPGPSGREAPKRIVAVILPREERTWFIKLMGPADVVSAQKSNFDTFVRSIHFDAAGPATLPSFVDKSSLAPAGEPAGPATLKSYQAPADWKVVASNTAFRVLSFKVSGANAQGEVVVSKLPATGTGLLLDNFNRWRGQAGLPPVADEQAVVSEPVKVGTKAGMLFDITGPQASAPVKRLLIAMIRVGDENWFFKMTGPADLVGQQRAAFVAFLGSVQFGGDGSE